MGWVVLELTPKGEKENPQVVREEVRRYLPGADVYVPAIETQVGEDQIVHYLMKGYAFVREAQDPRSVRDYRRLENTRFIQSVLRSGNRLTPVEDSYIEEMREKIRAEVNQGIGIGDTVEICSGPFKNIEASVIVELPETKEVQVFVQLRSKQALLTLPRSALKVVDRAPLSPYFARLGYLRAWASMAKVLLAYDAPHERLHDTYVKYAQVSQWLSRGAKLYSLLNSERGSFDRGLAKINADVRLLARVEKWLQEGKKLYSFVFFEQDFPEQRLALLTEKYLQLVWLDSVESRVLGISRDVEGLARDLAYTRKDESMTVQNVLVDGNNLAHRCFHAPGLGQLRSKDGRMTGVITGFLRSLGALKKRFPEAKFWVAWDGSSQRRRRLYGEYKAGRNTAKFPDQLEFLKEVLPSLGIRQVWNPEEEADDIIGTLVRKDLATERNLVFSTDRDFLQVVTDTTMLLTPSIGSRKEVLYSPEKVKEAFGVPPERMVHLRAFYGDKSDNLPGVPRVPKKTLRALVAAHQTVTGVYSSGLSALSKGHYDRLRVAEAQVRINLQVMSLVDVEPTRLYPDVDADGASKRLRGIDLVPDPIITAFFGKASLQESGQ
jgi:5'-3' exonuclease/transcription antitermination factor NusG